MLPVIDGVFGLSEPTTTQDISIPVSRRASSQPRSSGGVAESPSSSFRKPIATAENAWSSMDRSRGP